jgi:hypothetical protein
LAKTESRHALLVNATQAIVVIVIDLDAFVSSACLPRRRHRRIAAGRAPAGLPEE